MNVKLNRRQFVALATSGATALTLAACGGNNAQSAETAGSADDEAAGAAIAGGWTVNKNAEPIVNPDEDNIFWDAMETSGVSGQYEPVAVLATQLVSGTNYAYLATGADGWYIVVVYADLEYNCSITSAQPIDLTDIKTLDNADDTEGMTGAWEIAETDTGVLSDDAQTAFDTANAAYTGVSLNPIAELGSQVVAGTNYYVLCNGAVVYPDAPSAIYVAEVFADLEGGAEFSDVAVFDLLSYIG